MFPTPCPGLTQPTQPAGNAASSTATTAHWGLSSLRSALVAPALVAVLLALVLALCSCGATQAARPSSAESARQATNALATSRTSRTSNTPLFRGLFISPTIQQFSQEWRLRGGGGYAAATCPQGDYALGGGWIVPDTQASVYSAQVSGASWRVGVRAIGHPIVVFVTAYVECLLGATSATLIQRPVSTYAVPNGTAVVGDAYCNPGETLVGGGFDLSASNGSLEVQQDAPIEYGDGGDTFLFFDVENHNSIVEPFTFSAECLSDVMASRYPLAGSVQVNVSASYLYAAPAPVTAGETETLSVACPSGSWLAGGGFNYGNSDGARAAGMGNLYSQYGTAPGWDATLYNLPAYGPATFDFTVGAVCLAFG
ncbi:MAG TPA: hypothetical protein VMV29_02005 [Ktedonobacterales bacterium]|nr:hypothetical protein [Ktedonobacterales bacterium]